MHTFNLTPKQAQAYLILTHPTYNHITELGFGGGAGGGKSILGCIWVFNQCKQYDGVAYAMTWASPWMNFGQEAHDRLKIIKSFYAHIYGGGDITGDARWGFDYRPLEHVFAYTSTYVASGAEFNDGEWGSGEFGLGLRARKVDIAGSGQGQVVKFYLTLQSDVDRKIALAEVGTRAKIGRRV